MRPQMALETTPDIDSHESSQSSAVLNNELLRVCVHRTVVHNSGFADRLIYLLTVHTHTQQKLDLPGYTRRHIEQYTVRRVGNVRPLLPCYMLDIPLLETVVTIA